MRRRREVARRGAVPHDDALCGWCLAAAKWRQLRQRGSANIDVAAAPVEPPLQDSLKKYLALRAEQRLYASNRFCRACDGVARFAPLSSASCYCHLGLCSSAVCSVLTLLFAGPNGRSTPSQRYEVQMIA